jgi:hypothetical protein
MTLIALAVGRRQAVLAADSIATHPISADRLGCVSKVAAVPHLRAVAGWCGYSGLARAFTMIPPLPAGATVEDVLDYLRPVLLMLFAEAARKQPPVPAAAMVLAGVVGHGEAAEVVAFALRAADGWQPLLLAPGKVFTLGATLEDTPEPGAREVIESDHTTLGEPPAHAAAAPTAEHSMSWLELSRMPEKLVQLARSERPDTVGGPVQSVLLTCEAAFFAWDDRDP